MKKIDDHLENPIDYYIINHICEPLSTFIRENFPDTTPNFITFIGLIVGLLAILCLYYNLFAYAFIFIWIAYIIDCLDGYYARKYNMVTKIGDYFDHIRDSSIGFIVIVMILIKLQRKEQIMMIVVVVITLITMNMHLACQKNEEESILHSIKSICQEDKMEVLKFFGCGTYNLIISLYILYLFTKKIN